MVGHSTLQLVDSVTGEKVSDHTNHIGIRLPREVVVRYKESTRSVFVKGLPGSTSIEVIGRYEDRETREASYFMVMVSQIRAGAVVLDASGEKLTQDARRGLEHPAGLNDHYQAPDKASYAETPSIEAVARHTVLQELLEETGIDLSGLNYHLFLLPVAHKELGLCVSPEIEATLLVDLPAKPDSIPESRRLKASEKKAELHRHFIPLEELSTAPHRAAALVNHVAVNNKVFAASMQFSVAEAIPFRISYERPDKKKSEEETKDFTKRVRASLEKKDKQDPYRDYFQGMRQAYEDAEKYATSLQDSTPETSSAVEVGPISE